MKKKIFSLVLLALVFVASLTGGIYSSVQAAEQKSIFAEQTKYEQRYQKVIDKAEKTNNVVLNSQYFKSLYEGKLKDAKIQASLAKSQLKKYFAFAAVMMFVAMAMLVCIITMAMSLSKSKAQATVDTAEPVENPENKDDFAEILEAPKAHISAEE